MEKKCKVKGSASGSGKDMHLDNLFLGLNENGEVVLWKPIKSKSFQDIKYALIEFKDKLESSGHELNTILVSNCCESRALYQEIFPEVPVKMGITHAIKAVTDTLPRENPDTMAFAHKLLQIFSSSSTEQQRTEETTSPLEIEANLDFLLTNWRTRLLEPTMVACDHLRYHIRKGCLSGIPPGEGTEKIDNLHRYLQKSFLSRITVTTPDMAFAIITCILYAWNCKKQCKNLFKGKKVIPIMPIEAQELKPKQNTIDSDHSKIDFKGLTDKGIEPLVIECTQQNNSAVVTSMLVITADVVEYMFIRLLHIQDLINAFKDKCQKSFGVSDFPIFSSNGGISPYEKLISESSEQEKNTEVLYKNLSEYGLEIDKVPGDGNCLFRSIVLQVQRLAQYCPELEKYLELIGMGKTQEEDTTKLRELFVTELQNNFAGYKEWINITNINLEQDLSNFSEDGFFASDIGDLCIKLSLFLLFLSMLLIITQHLGTMIVLKVGLPCTATCFCRNCGNGKPQEEPEETIEEETPRKRIRKGYQIKVEPEKWPTMSEWTEQELEILRYIREKKIDSKKIRLIPTQIAEHGVNTVHRSNLKKSWHPQTIRNVERVWKAEQKATAETKKIEQLQRELLEERAREDMQRHAVEQGISKKKSDRLEWMYATPGQVDREQYLLGKTIDKHVDPLANDDKETNNVPGASFSSDANANTPVDLAAKVRDDPLFLIKKKEEEKKKEFLHNPLKMKHLRQMLQENLDKSTKKKEKKRKKDKKEKRRKAKKYEESSDERQKHRKRKHDSDMKVESFSSDATASVSDRIKRNINSLQRTTAALDTFLVRK
ncbi:hypothetical protein QZH41_000381 [Actinostola sp. cb2023]|nr:hypothetical protein QZH41_000381 [Actinostola sp. cb2023]